MLGFETILPFLRPIEHLIRDESIRKALLKAQTAAQPVTVISGALIATLFVISKTV
jgi:hypothetical protein